MQRTTSAPERAPEDWAAAEELHEYDALADLFLGDEPAQGAARAAAPATAPPQPRDLRSLTPSQTLRPLTLAHDAAPRVGVEALLFGHLPAMPGAWAGQYAAFLAAQTGRPVALVRSSAGLISLDLHGAPAGSASRSATLVDALMLAARIAPLFLVRVDPADEPSRSVWEGVDGLTLLTSADAPAVLAAYRAIKGLVADPAPSDVSMPPRVEVVFVGAPHEDAALAGAKIASAARSHLDHPIEWSIGPAQVSPAPAWALFRGRSPGPFASLLGSIRLAVEAASIDAAPSPTPEPLASRGSLEDALPEPVAGWTEAKPSAPNPRPAASPSGASRSLCSLLGGLTPTPFRCPHAPDVELAIDAEGALHLLCDAPRDAVASLLGAGAWAGANAALVRAAAQEHAGRRGACDQAPVLHLFVREARAARGALDTTLRVHLLVRSAGADIAADLN